MNIALATVTLTSTTFAFLFCCVGCGIMYYICMFISEGSDVTLRQCSFISNTASDKGHAIYTDHQQ